MKEKILEGVLWFLEITSGIILTVMVVLLLFAIVCGLMSGCATVQPKDLNSLTDRVAQLEFHSQHRLKALEDEAIQLNYYIQHDKCFNSYAVCLSERKKTQKACWAMHEECVISVARAWKRVKTIRGIQ